MPHRAGHDSQAQQRFKQQALSLGPTNTSTNPQRYDNPFERQANQVSDERLIRDAAKKYGVQDTGAGSNIRNELERMRNKGYVREKYLPGNELKLANSNNLGINAVGGNQFFTAQRPTFADVRGDIGRRLSQDARNYGGGVMSMLANAVLPGAGFFTNMMQGAGNGMQGGMQKLIDYRPQMIQPREGVMGGIDKLFNIGKGMIGGKNYEKPQAALPVINNSTNMADSGTHPLMPMFMDIQNRTDGEGFEDFEEFLDVYFNQSMLS